jgi:radical SAM protein with 4Fe4S-binding SPASM domain
MVKMHELKKPPLLRGYNFPHERARAARDNGKLLSMRTETSNICNIRCRYCNGASGRAPSNEITFDKIKSVISQVKELGGESVVVIGGGEPTIYPDFKGLISFIHKLDMIPVVITNTTMMSMDLAKFLFDTNSSVLTKLDSLQEERQDYLAGVKGTYRKIQVGINNLARAGFTSSDNGELRMGASFVTTSLTLDETTEIWKFCRENNIYPNQEVLVPRGKAIADLSQLAPSVEELKNVKKELLELDQKLYGYTWLLYAPLTGHGCMQPMYSVYLTAKGYVRPCADIDIASFNVSDMTMKEILDTPFFKIARHIEKNLEGKCGRCEYLKECIGCRGIAYSTGMLEGKNPFDALVREDPFCVK